MTIQRTFVAVAVAGAAAVSPVAFAQNNWPSKPIRIISPFSAGGGNDTLCRTISPKLSEALGQQVIVENRAGANGIVGTELAARAVPDGHTIILIPSGHAVNASLYKKLPYDSIKDFAPITLVGASPLLLAVHPSVPVRSVKELVAFAKARPGELTFASAGIGSSGHLAGALFSTMTGAQMVHVPYKGMSLAVIDVIGGQVTLTFGTMLSTLPHVKNKRLRALGITSAQRSQAVPEIPTVAEGGLPGYEASLWYGFVGPAGIPPAVIRRLNAEIIKVLKLPEVRDRLAGQGVEAKWNTPQEFSRLLVSDLDRWAKVVKRAGVKPR